MPIDSAAPTPVEHTPTPLEDLESVGAEMFKRWDKDMRAGKLLIALCGGLRDYDPRVTRIRAALNPENSHADAQ